MASMSAADHKPAVTAVSLAPHRSTRPSATRMARLRERRHRGFRCYSVEVSEGDIDALVARGFLDRLRRGDPGAVERAIGGLLDRL